MNMDEQMLIRIEEKNNVFVNKNFGHFYLKIPAQHPKLIKHIRTHKKTNAHLFNPFNSDHSQSLTHKIQLLGRNHG